MTLQEALAKHYEEWCISGHGTSYSANRAVNDTRSVIVTVDEIHRVFPACIGFYQVGHRDTPSDSHVCDDPVFFKTLEDLERLLIFKEEIPVDQGWVDGQLAEEDRRFLQSIYQAKGVRRSDGVTLREALDASAASFAALLISDGRPTAAYMTADGYRYSVVYAPDALDDEMRGYHLWLESVDSTGLALLHEVFSTLEEVEVLLLFERLVRINAGWEPLVMTGRINGVMSWHWPQREGRHSSRVH